MLNSSLYDEKTFYTRFIKDLLHATHEVVVENPYITRERMRGLFPIFEALVKRGVCEETVQIWARFFERETEITKRTVYLTSDMVEV